MAKGNNDKNYISVWHWMLILLLAAIPCVGLFVIIIGAFLGENESRKNYFRALLAWFLFFVLLWILVVTLGFWPEILKQFRTWLHQFH